jgi:HEAT repeats
VRAEVEALERLLGGKSDPGPTVPAKIPRREHGPLDAMTPQAQAELLLEEATQNERGAIEDLNARVDGWRGLVQMTPRLSQEMEPALNASDLQIRAASLELFLAVYDVAKQPESFSSLEQRITEEPDARPWALFSLGALGNRGIDPMGARRKLTDYVNDANEDTRAWAVEGLAVLGTNEAIDPLLDALRSDPSSHVRDRAACGLAEAGMFTHEQRLSAVPRLLDLVEDPSSDATTRGYVFHALQDITHAGKGTDVRAWREWWIKANR